MSVCKENTLFISSLLFSDRPFVDPSDNLPVYYGGQISLVFLHYSVMQSDGNSSDGDIDLGSFNNISRDEDSFLY